MYSSSTGNNVVYVDYRSTASHLACPESSTAPGYPRAYFNPGAPELPELERGSKAPPLIHLMSELERKARLRSVLAEADSRYGEMLQRLAE